MQRTVQLTYNIEIDRDNWIACATCPTIDPVHFEGDSKEKSKVVGGKNNERSTGSFGDSNIADA
jgi:ferredoxin